MYVILFVCEIIKSVSPLEDDLKNGLSYKIKNTSFMPKIINNTYKTNIFV